VEAMKYRIQEVKQEAYFRYLDKKWQEITVYYPQYKKWLFWKNFEEAGIGPKWIYKYAPYFRYKEEAEKYLNEIQN
jgi:hypothetical protein